jgi:hypothetical protein
MTFIISHGTFVTGFDAVQSVNLDLNPQIQRLYQLGVSTPYSKNITKQKRLTLTVYGGANSSYNVEASSACVDANTINVSVSANGCGGDSIAETDEWFVASYSYNKDMQGWGTETWNLISRPISLKETGAEDPAAIDPIMVRGVAEGQATLDGGASVGVVFLGTTLEGSTIQVQAGSPGIGRANEVLFGEVSEVGGSTTGKSDGKDGSASVNIPYAPIYIP